MSIFRTTIGLPSSSRAEPGARWAEVPESLDKARKLEVKTLNEPEFLKMLG